ncbi:MAG: flagellar basal-body MS-ring/collar protein FliF [Pseudomonadota bacterium]
MADGLTFTGLRDAYAAASPARKLVWGVIILLLLALPAVLLWQDAQTPREYRVLYAELSDRDGGEVVDALERLNIPYRLADADGSVLVPADRFHVARYKLAAQGLPRGDKPAGEDAGQRFGVSPFQEQLGYQRRLEAELARSVESIEDVESARVHLALPRQSAFLRERVPPAASVLVKLRTGAAFDEDKVEALRQIVAGGVPGMNPGQVSVVDQRGILLAAGVADFYRGLSPDQMEYARRLESDLAGRVRRVLSPVLGDAAFKVQVTARIDFSESEETIERAHRTGAGTGSLDRSVRHVREPRGRLLQASTLIVVDEGAGFEAAELDRFATLARQAVGFEPGRGDSLQVIALPFAAAQAPAAASAAKAPLPVLPAAKPRPSPLDDELLPVYLGLALALLFMLLLIALRARHRRLRRLEQAHAAEPGETFEARLDGLRRRVLADPKLAASVVKLWVHNP